MVSVIYVNDQANLSSTTLPMQVTGKPKILEFQLTAALQHTDCLDSQEGR